VHSTRALDLIFDSEVLEGSGEHVAGEVSGVDYCLINTIEDVGGEVPAVCVLQMM
jgi:hypothetical protein